MRVIYLFFIRFPNKGKMQHWRSSKTYNLSVFLSVFVICLLIGNWKKNNVFNIFKQRHNIYRIDSKNERYDHLKNYNNGFQNNIILKFQSMSKFGHKLKITKIFTVDPIDMKFKGQRGWANYVYFICIALVYPTMFNFLFYLFYI